MDTYSLLDFGNGQRLEQWGPFTLVRPDPTALGLPLTPDLWKKADATFVGEKGKGTWKTRSQLPEQWPVQFDDIQMSIKLAPYKHTGAFPEQQQNWQWARAQAAKPQRTLHVLNLFAYTGGMTMALAKDGHFITHVDSSKPSITWAKENAVLNELSQDRVRWMLDDVPTFVARELKRGKRYDAIILDPPAYGHGSKGGTWRMERDLAPLLENCARILSEQPAFLLLNGYAQHDTPDSFHRLLTGIIRTKIPNKKCSIETGDLTLTAKDGRTLSTGTVARCSF